MILHLSPVLPVVGVPSFETLVIRKGVGEHVAQVALNRPQKRNAMNARFWR